MTVAGHVDLRPARAGDTAAIAELWTAAYVRSGLIPSDKPFSSDRVRRAADQAELIVADESGHVVGAVALAAHGAPLANLTHHQDERQICLLAVLPDRQGNGIGSALMRWCISRAREEGAKTVLLWTRPSQVKAHRLYENLGFARVPELDSAPDGHARLSYSLRLQ